MFGFGSRDEMLELESVAGLYENPDDRRQELAVLEAEGIIRDNQILMKRKDGTLLIVQDSSAVIRNQAGEIVAYRGILKDVTDKMKLEEQLLQSQKLESLGQLTSGIAHDFNNVLGGIIGFTELALGKIEKAHPVNNYLMRIYGLADRAAKITKQLLAFARRQILMPKDIDLNELIGNMLEFLKRLLGEQIRIEFAPGEQVKTIHADPSQIEQVILNLAVNAGDAMPEGGVLAIYIGTVELDDSYCRTHPDVKQGEYVVMSVSDTGVGIAPDAIEKIFEPFFTTKEVGKGTGLGLSVVHGIVKQHGGTVNAYSETGRGTTFKVYFPAVNRVAEQVPEKHRDLESISKGFETILVVEDNDELREFMKTLLTESGYTVLTATDGEEGLAVFDAHPQEISLVISDVVMPNLNGREFRNALEQKYPGRKFLFISGYTDSAVQRGFVLDDKIDFLQKPFSAFEFSDMVRNILDRSS
jgi:PAS domain S-box-containing protein